MGEMVCLCGKRYKDPLNVYTQEKDHTSCVKQDVWVVTLQHSMR